MSEPGTGTPLEDEKDLNIITPVTIEKTNEANQSQSEKGDLHMSTETESYKSKQNEDSRKSIEKVIILYSDGKFKEYRQE